MEGYQIIRDMSDDEIWPFVLLVSPVLTIMKSCDLRKGKEDTKRSPVIFCGR